MNAKITEQLVAVIRMWVDSSVAHFTDGDVRRFDRRVRDVVALELADSAPWSGPQLAAAHVANPNDVAGRVLLRALEMLDSSFMVANAMERRR